MATLIVIYSLCSSSLLIINKVHTPQTEMLLAARHPARLMCSPMHPLCMTPSGGAHSRSGFTPGLSDEGRNMLGGSHSLTHARSTSMDPTTL